MTAELQGWAFGDGEREGAVSTGEHQLGARAKAARHQEESSANARGDARGNAGG